MRILLLSRYSQIGSSSRLRHYQFLPFLAAEGIEVDIAPLLPDDYLSTIYRSRQRPLAIIAAAYLRRIRASMRVHDYDLVWVEKEVLPWLPYGIEELLLRGVPYVIDFDDAWFHVYDLHRSRLVRSLLGKKLDALMHNAALVTVGNSYLLSRALHADAKRILLLPTVVDVSRYPVPEPREGGAFTIGWIGSPVTARYLQLVEEPLARVIAGNGGDVRLTLVGTRPDDPPALPALRLDWSEDTEVASIATFDIGIMPLANSPWERGKCGYKLIQYMACGLPVVASPTGVNRDIVEHGVNGFLAETPDEWYQAIERLRTDPALRSAMGTAGRAKVEREYNLASVAPRLIEELHHAAGGRAVSAPGAPPASYTALHTDR